MYTQGRHGQFLAGKATTLAATLAATFYSAKSRQGIGLGGLASRRGPDTNRALINFFLVLELVSRS